MKFLAYFATIWSPEIVGIDYLKSTEKENQQDSDSTYPVRIFVLFQQF
jgi:hypothetical protein